MLTLNLRDNLHPIIKQLLTDFRRVQVSRFPIIVEQHVHDNDSVKFVDSRFPTDTWRKDRVLAILHVEGVDAKMRPIIRLYSRLIENAKYSDTSEGYNTRETADPKKMLGFLRQYVKPYQPQELMDKMDAPTYEHDQWVQQPRQEFYNLASKVRGDVLAKEIMYLQSMGVQFQSEEFREVATKGIELHFEAMRRKDVKSVLLMVMMQPDESVLVSWPSIHGIEMGSRTYERLEMCPECIQQQVAILRLCDQGTFVPEVGRRKNQTTYWIHVNPNEFNFSNT